jgi:hypothetical protein
MIIHCKIKRVGGTFVTLDDNEYHFKPGKERNDPHACEVTDERHIALILAIPEAYVDPSAAPEPQVASLPADDEDDLGMTVDVGGAQVDLAKLSARELESLAEQCRVDAQREGIEANIAAVAEITKGNPKKAVLAQRIFDYLTNE